VLKEYTLPFVGLKDGKHTFNFTIDNTFFEHFEFHEFNEASLEGLLILDKKTQLFRASF